MKSFSLKVFLFPSILSLYVFLRRLAQASIEGIIPQNISYRLINLIFWIVMGCGMARFGRRGLKTT